MSAVTMPIAFVEIPWVRGNAQAYGRRARPDGQIVHTGQMRGRCLARTTGRTCSRCCQHCSTTTDARGGRRRAGAEAIWTGRARPYDESTLCKHARPLARRGGTDVIARAVEAQVHKAVAD